MTESKKHTYWFPVKTFGWGWGLPNCWQGWATLIAYTAAMLSAALQFTDGEQMSVGFYLSVAIFTVIFCFIVWWKGEKPQ